MEHPRRIEMHPPRRVLILGNIGAGKGELGTLIADRVSLPLVSLAQDLAQEQTRAEQTDNSHQPINAEHWRSYVNDRAGNAFWVMAGNDPETFDLRVPRADWIIWIDLPVMSCLTHRLRKLFQGKIWRQPSKDLFSWPDVRAILNFPVEVAPLINRMIERERRNRTIFILRSRQDVTAFVARLPEFGGMGGSGLGGTGKGKH